MEYPDNSNKKVIIPWETGIIASWYRANEYVNCTIIPEKQPPIGVAPGTIKYSRPEEAVVLHLVEENTEQNWKIFFQEFYAIRIIPEDLAWNQEILPNLPENKNRGFFKILNSSWIKDSENKHSIKLSGYTHFVVSTYDWLIEIIAKEPKIEKVDKLGYSPGHGRIKILEKDVYQGPPPPGKNLFSKILRAKLKSRET